jgi:ABC-type transport system involved in multi-copper enzyme maturation permease subunit
MPFLAILRHDLRSLRQSWLARLWLAASALLTLLLVLTEWREFPIAPLIGSLLVPYLVFPWFLVVMVLGVNPVSGSRADSLADGFLSRPITRHEYLLAVWASRVVLVLSAYLVVIVPAVACVTLAKRPAATDTVTVYGVIAGLAVVGLVLIFQVSLSFLFGTLLRKPLLAIVILLFLWYPANILMSAFKMEALSPISLARAMPALLRQPWSKPERTADSAITDVQDERFRAQAEEFLSVLSGAQPPKPAKEGFFVSEDYKDISPLRVALGYGLPALAAVSGAVLIFSRRDL